MHDNNEDQIIAKGLMSIREGILSGSWSTVCEGYNAISGEDLKPAEKPKSRLENIRGLLKVDSKEKSSENYNEPDPTLLTVSQIKQALVNKGFEEGKLKGIKKNDLIVLLESGKNTAQNVDKIVDDEVGEIIIQKGFIGGRKFAAGGFEVISTARDESEYLDNLRRHKRKNGIPNRKRASITERLESLGSEQIGYHDKNRRPPEKD
jgi:hypothetical protein